MPNQNQRSGISPALIGIMLFAAVMLVAALALGAGLAGLVPLPGFKHPAREARRLQELHGAEIRAIQETLKQKRLLFEETLREARESIPPDSPIAGDWHADTSIAELTMDDNNRSLLSMLSSAYLWDPCNMLAYPYAKLADKLDSFKSLEGRITHLERRFLDAADDNLLLKDRFEEYLLTDANLVELELALEHGVLELYPPIQTWAQEIPWDITRHFVMGLMAARIAMHAEQGNTDRALLLLTQVFDLQRRTRDLADHRWNPLSARVWDGLLGFLTTRIEWTDDRVDTVASLLACTNEDAVLMMKANAVEARIHDSVASSAVGLEQLQCFDVVTSLTDTFLNAPAELPSQLSEMGAEVEKRMLKFPHMIMFSMGIPHPVDAMLSGIETVSYYANLPLRSQSFDLAMILERHYQSHGTYPESLGEVGDDFQLPVDVLTGKSLVYTREDQGYAVTRDDTRAREELRTLLRVHRSEPFQ